MSNTAEQKARDLLERLSTANHYNEPQLLPAGDLVELANLFAEIDRLQNEVANERASGGQVNYGLKQLANQKQAEIQRLTQQLNRVQADVELWAVTGRHRTCTCPACENLRNIAEALGGE